MRHLIDRVTYALDIIVIMEWVSFPFCRLWLISLAVDTVDRKQPAKESERTSQ